MTKKTALLILDGWGLGQIPAVDAIAQADTPFTDNLLKKYPHSTLVTYGMEVGLPHGQMGNSEVGHLNIGAGRIVYQQFARINKAIEDGELAQNQILVEAVKKAITANRPIHLFGLLSDGGVHSHIEHLKALIVILEDLGAKKVFIHAFMDGRDTAPKGGIGYLQEMNAFLAGRNTQIATIVGRYYAMDRDQRWERIEKAYDALVNAKGIASTDLIKSIQASYDAGLTDEFIEPIIHVDDQGQAIARMKDSDLLICFNFRTDRPREISQVLTQADMHEYNMHKLEVTYLTMTRYDESFKNVQILFEHSDLINTLGETLAKASKTQLRIAETEKYPHVTFFFSGGREDTFEGEDRILIPSPKVATYDLKPEMSALELTSAIITYLEKRQPDFICLNYANADMVGHTGDFEAAKRAVEAVDNCVSNLVPTLLKYEYDIIIIADHGNADFMINADGTPNTAHTKNLVPCILVSNQIAGRKIKSGKLADIAPTLLAIMGIDQPAEMTGSNLIE
jgi:2,3-bisphosphoglycerate-independent phosphoglycerate mutase